MASYDVSVRVRYETRKGKFASMPRPKRVSDEAVLDEASRLLLEVGFAKLTLSDVAAGVGIARATLIQRFQNRETILRQVAERQVVITAQYLSGLPRSEEPGDLWRFLETIVRDMGDGEGFGVHVELAWLEAADPELRRHAAARYDLVQRTIADRMPISVAAPMAAATVLHAVIAGATMQWVVTRSGTLSEYVLSQLKIAHDRLTGIDL